MGWQGRDDRDRDGGGRGGRRGRGPGQGRHYDRRRSPPPHRSGGGGGYRREREPWGQQHSQNQRQGFHERRRSRSPSPHRNWDSRGSDRGSDRALPYERASSQSPPRDFGGRGGGGGARRRSRSRTPPPRHQGERELGKAQEPPATAEAKALASNLEESFVETGGFDAEQEAMMKMMGFGSFNTTQGAEVKTNQGTGAVKVKSTRQARQYMNRKGGFNRPLPAEKTGEKNGNR